MKLMQIAEVQLTRRLQSVVRDASQADLRSGAPPSVQIIKLYYKSFRLESRCVQMLFRIMYMSLCEQKYIALGL